MKTQVSHIALVLPDVEIAAQKLQAAGFQVGALDVFEEEGTKEIYVEYGKLASLLLMQPTKAGSYQKALAKRGPGLHHIAVDVLVLEESVKEFTEVGWVLHANSQKSMDRLRVAWLYKPQFPALIEVMEVKSFLDSEVLVQKIKLAFHKDHQKLVDALNLQNFIEYTSQETELCLGDQYIKIADLIK